MNDELIGNLTTIIKFVVMTIAPYLSLSEALQNQLIAVIVAVIGFGLAYYDAKYENTLIGNSTSTVSDNITDEIQETTYSDDDDTA